MLWLLQELPGVVRPGEIFSLSLSDPHMFIGTWCSFLLLVSTTTLLVVSASEGRLLSLHLASSPVTFILYIGSSPLAICLVLLAHFIILVLILRSCKTVRKLSKAWCSKAKSLWRLRLSDSPCHFQGAYIHQKQASSRGLVALAFSRM